MLYHGFSVFEELLVIVEIFTILSYKMKCYMTSGLGLKHGLPQARTDHMDVLEGGLFLLVPENFL